MAFIGLAKPTQQRLARLPAVGELAPALPDPAAPGGSTCVVFLRHTGCPFAEATVRGLRNAALHPGAPAFLLVGHGDADALRHWVSGIGRLPEGVVLLADPQRHRYGQWGLGYTPASHFLGWRALLGVAALLVRGVRNRSASGTRWQGAGAFLVDSHLRVRWRHLPGTAADLPDWDEMAAVASSLRQPGAGAG